jgi:hypothetical protein
VWRRGQRSAAGYPAGPTPLGLLYGRDHSGGLRSAGSACG